MSKPMKARTKTSDQRHSNTNPDISGGLVPKLVGLPLPFGDLI
jgi:hypothetical protein